MTEVEQKLAHLTEELERLRGECSVCESCGHVQAEPSWCHKCGHAVAMPEWARRLVGEVDKWRAKWAEVLDRGTDAKLT